MKIKAVSRSEKASEKYDFRGAFQIIIDSKSEFHVADGEPEDSNLFRNFSDCYSVPRLLRQAYEAGKRGEELKIEESESDDI